jgi:hypothetical protein
MNCAGRHEAGCLTDIYERVMRRFGDGMNQLMFCLRPDEYVAQTELTDFPRNLCLVLDDPKLRRVYESDYFQLTFCETWAWLIWDYLVFVAMGLTLKSNLISNPVICYVICTLRSDRAIR